MKNKAYWEKRAEYVANLQFDKTDNYILDLDLEYKKALDSIQKEIDAIYNKNDINNLAYNAKMARLKELKAQINSIINHLYESQNKDLTTFLGGVYKDTYYRNIFEVYKGLGIGVNFVKVDDKAIKEILKEPWNGANYSDRIWRNKQIIIKELQSNLTQSFIRGDSIDKTSKIVTNRMHVANGAARRLVNTESAYITSKATLDGYSNSGVLKQYEILATLDLHTSKICRSMDGKVFNLEEKKIGVNAPPFHPNCRSTTIPYFDDADDERIARDHKGNSYCVKGNTKYEDWYKEHVSNNLQALISEKKIQNKSSDKKQYIKYKEVFGKQVESFDKFQDMKYNNTKKWDNFQSNFKNIFVTKEFKDIVSFHKNTSNLLTRKWYKWHDENIPNLVDTTKPIEDQARQAHNLRNTYRTQARDLMENQEERKNLDLKHPNNTFEELLEHKKLKYGLTDKEAFEDIVRSSQTTNKKYDKIAGIKED